MATTSEHELAELKRELAELAKQAERPAGEISGKRAGRAKGSADELFPIRFARLAVGQYTPSRSNGTSLARTGEKSQRR